MTLKCGMGVYGMDSIYSVMILSCVVVMIGMSFHVGGNAILPAPSRRWFILAFIGIALAALAELAGVRLDEYRIFPGVHRFVKLMEFCIAPMVAIPVFFACGIRKPAISLGIVMLVHACMEILLYSSGKIFWISANGDYHRGEWYFLYICFYVISIGYVLTLFVSLSRRFRNRDRVTLLCSLVALALGVAPSVIFSGVKTAYLGIMLLVMILYVYYEGLTEQDLANELSRQNENVRSMQEKILIGIADLIESRDRSTGTHVKNTSEYVRLLAGAALNEGLYPETINESFVQMVIRVAPLFVRRIREAR